MNKIKDYLTNPNTIISFIVFVFWLWVMWSTLNGRVALLEEKCHEVDTVKAQMYEIQTTLAQIQTDVLRIKQSLAK